MTCGTIIMIIDTILCEWEREYWPISSTQHDGSSHIGTSYNNIIIVKIIVHKGLRGGSLGTRLSHGQAEYSSPLYLHACQLPFL